MGRVFAAAFLLLVAATVVVGLPATPPRSGNMNGKYSVTSVGSLHTNFNDDYGSTPVA